MDKTNHGKNTPGGRPGSGLENPSSTKAGLTDSGTGQLLLAEENIMLTRSSKTQRTPPNSEKPSRINELAVDDEGLPTQLNEIEIKDINYYNEWQKETKARLALEITINNMQKHITNLENKIMLIDANNASVSHQAQSTALHLQDPLKNDECQGGPPSSYSTDESEFDDDIQKENLNKETEFILIKSKKSRRTAKKRKASNSPEISNVKIKTRRKTTSKYRNKGTTSPHQSMLLGLNTMTR